jgi:hypothetical protein
VDPPNPSHVNPLLNESSRPWIPVMIYQWITLIENMIITFSYCLSGHGECGPNRISERLFSRPLKINVCRCDHAIFSKRSRISDRILSISSLESYLQPWNVGIMTDCLKCCILLSCRVRVANRWFCPHSCWSSSIFLRGSLWFRSPEHWISLGQFPWSSSRVFRSLCW